MPDRAARDSAIRAEGDGARDKSGAGPHRLIRQTNERLGDQGVHHSEKMVMVVAMMMMMMANNAASECAMHDVVRAARFRTSRVFIVDI